MGSQVSYVVNGSPSFISHEVRRFWRGLTTPGLGDVWSAGLLTTYKSWDGPPSKGFWWIPHKIKVLTKIQQNLHIAIGNTCEEPPFSCFVVNDRAPDRFPPSRFPVGRRPNEDLGEVGGNAGEGDGGTSCCCCCYWWWCCCRCWYYWWWWWWWCDVLSSLTMFWILEMFSGVTTFVAVSICFVTLRHWGIQQEPSTTSITVRRLRISFLNHRMWLQSVSKP